MSLPWHTRAEMQAKAAREREQHDRALKRSEAIQDLELELALTTAPLHVEALERRLRELEDPPAPGLTYSDREGDVFTKAARKAFTDLDAKAEVGPVEILKGKGSFAKDDDKKPKLNLLPPRAILAIGRVLTKGASKYGPDNWRKCPDLDRYVAALFRHLVAYMMGEKRDPETGENHMAHAACCAMFIVGIEEGVELIEEEASACICITAGVPQGSCPNRCLGGEYGEFWAKRCTTCNGSGSCPRCGEEAQADV